MSKKTPVRIETFQPEPRQWIAGLTIKFEKERHLFLGDFKTKREAKEIA